ncbi:hypothetical protein BXZ70DRAFT_390118 [Cristinia sonorae]|uniref:Uncharacterized protein n=1 Tax=Cristinia sonorae TaxID=1940300 RepID=A0A8K0XMY5_9AGAR|nr:hypothetical protein BXZ70DRAFT_390118 [Cristinia sonorae]
MSQNTVAYPSVDSCPPAYSFQPHQKAHLSQAPPDYENVPPSPLSNTHHSGRRRSSVMLSITTWAENVPPGSPAPPRRKESFAAESNEDKMALKAAGYTTGIMNFQDVLLPPTVPVKKSRYSMLPEPRSSQKERNEVRRSNSQSSLKGHHSSRTRSSRHPNTATSQTPIPPPTTSSAVKDKKAKYGQYPAPLDRDLVLTQFLDGGNSEDQIRRFVEARAKATGAVKVNGKYVGAGDIWRDDRGGVWRDQDEELEYARLLPKETKDKSWVGFGGGKSKTLAVPSAEDELRRGSVSTMDTMDSDLDPRYVMQPDDEEVAKFGGAVPSHAHTHHAARHLRKPEALLDPFPEPSAHHSSKERRRPAPLAINVPSNSPAYVYSPENPAHQEAGRKDFMESSFSPAAVTAKQVPSKSGVTSHAPAETKSKLGVKGLLKAVGMKK